MGLRLLRPQPLDSPFQTLILCNWSQGAGCQHKIITSVRVILDRPHLPAVHIENKGVRGSWKSSWA